MLTNYRVCMIGGDARHLEIIHRLLELNAQVILVGFDQLDQAFTGCTSIKINELDFATVDAICLPIIGIGKNGEIDTIFSNEEIKLTKDHLAQTKERCMIFTGIYNEPLNKLAQSVNRKVVHLLERDDVAIYNSIPTVEGTILMAIQNTDFTIHGSNVVVLGLGRVGMTVARTFANLGAKVKVGARKPEHFARITEMNLEPFDLGDLAKELTTTDICINTIPKLVITENEIKQMLPHTLIIDLATKPGGTDFEFAKQRGIKALLAPGLPGVVAPKTAGKILAKGLINALTE